MKVCIRYDISVSYLYFFSMKNYQTALLRIPKLALASCVLTLLLKLSALGIEKFVGYPTAFDEAVTLLIHYPESIKAVFAFFSAVLFFLCVTFAIEPSDLGRIGRRWVFVPSLHVTVHMLSLAIGVFIAWAIIESVVSGVPYNSISKTIGVSVFSSAVLGGLAAFCAGTAVFLSDDFDKAMEWLGSWRLVVLLLIAMFLIWSVLQESVWNYRPGLIPH